MCPSSVSMRAWNATASRRASAERNTSAPKLTSNDPTAPSTIRVPIFTSLVIRLLMRRPRPSKVEFIRCGWYLAILQGAVEEPL